VSEREGSRTVRLERMRKTVRYRAVQADQIAIERHGEGIRIYLAFRGYLIRQEDIPLAVGEGVSVVPFGAIGLPAKTWRKCDRWHTHE
jgi:hypothetical protein